MAGSIIYQSYVEPLAPAVEEPSPVSWMQPQLPPTPHRYYRPASNIAVAGIVPSLLESTTQVHWFQPQLPPHPNARRNVYLDQYTSGILESLMTATEDITLDKWFVQHHLPTPHKTYWSETTTVYGWESLLLEEDDAEGTQRLLFTSLTLVNGRVVAYEADTLASDDLPEVPASKLPDVSTIAVGTYAFPTLTVDRHGRIVAISSNAPYQAPTPGTALIVADLEVQGDTVFKGEVAATPVVTLETVTAGDNPKTVVRQSRLTTTNAVATSIDLFTPTADKTYGMTAHVTGRRTGGSGGTADDGAYYVRSALITTKASVVTVTGVTSVVTQEDNAAWDCTIGTDGTSIKVTVTGDANNNITWHCTAYISEVGS